MGPAEGEITSVEFGWKIEFLFPVLGASVIPGHCGEKTGFDRRLIVCKWTKPSLSQIFGSNQMDHTSKRHSGEKSNQ